MFAASCGYSAVVTEPPPRPNSGTYVFYVGAALIFAFAAVVATGDGNVGAAAGFVAAAAATLVFTWQRARRSR
jgi:hypothetical protein